MLATIWPNAGLFAGQENSRGQYCVMNKMKLIELIARHAREVLPGLETHQFIPSDRLVDLGANSVDRAEIAMLVQESLDLSVPRVELFGPKNIGELADLFLQKLDAV
jgi:polyketide biosynthesis acyl carrier protein